MTIVPRTVGAVGAALTTGGTAAVQGIAMLNPQRWGGGGAGIQMGYSKDLGNNDADGGTLFEVGDDEFAHGEKDAASLIRCKFADILIVFVYIKSSSQLPYQLRRRPLKLPARQPPLPPPTLPPTPHPNRKAN